MDGVVMAEGFAHISCNSASEPQAIVTKILEAISLKEMSVEQTRTIAGEAGDIIVIEDGAYPTDGITITLFFADDADEVIVYANKLTDPTERDSQILNSVLDASELEGCAIPSEEI